MIVGAIALVCAVVLISAAGFILWADANFKNDSGYYSTDVLPLKIMVMMPRGSWAELAGTYGVWLPWLFGSGVALVVGGVVLLPLGTLKQDRISLAGPACWRNRKCVDSGDKERGVSFQQHIRKEVRPVVQVKDPRSGRGREAPTTEAQLRPDGRAAQRIDWPADSPEETGVWVSPGTAGGQHHPLSLDGRGRVRVKSPSSCSPPARGGEKREFGQVFCAYHEAGFLPCPTVMDGYAPP